VIAVNERLRLTPNASVGAGPPCPPSFTGELPLDVIEALNLLRIPAPEVDGCRRTSPDLDFQRDQGISYVRRGVWPQRKGGAHALENFNWGPSENVAWAGWEDLFMSSSKKRFG
jgi:hypothetical protein